MVAAAVNTRKTLRYVKRTRAAGPVDFVSLILVSGIAAWRAAWQMLSIPHIWEKTPHGLDEE